MNYTLMNRSSISTNTKIFLLLFSICFVTYVFTNDGHRSTMDEDFPVHQATWLATLTPHPEYVEGESGVYFMYKFYYPEGHRLNNSEGISERTICEHGLICSAALIGHSIAQVPFILINENFDIITTSEFFSIDDFTSTHYVWWRNSIDPNFTFMELFYGPTYIALAVGTLFLICRTFEFNIKSSIIVSLLFGFSTMAWAYSQTTFSSVFITFAILLSFLLFRKFQKNNSYIYLALSGITLGFGFLSRLDVVLVILVMSMFILTLIIKDIKKYNKKQNFKIFFKSFISFEIPIIISICIYRLIEISRSSINGVTSMPYSGFHPDNLANLTPFPVAMFGLLFSPGIGLFIFAPILFTVILSFTDFYKRNKTAVFFMIGLFMTYLIWFSTLVVAWHGLVGWAARYTLPIMPFLLIPLAASLTIRKGKFFTRTIIVLAILGVFFNLSYLVQDVTWFVWGQMGEHEYGLYSLDGGALRISPSTIWTFEFSQLSHAIYLMFYDLQPDIFLLHVMGSQLYTSLIIIILVPLIYALIKITKSTSIPKKDLGKNEFKYTEL